VKAINARAETVAEKPTFRSAFRSRCCLIPASGYFEWKHEGKAKRPHFIHPAHGELFAFAGLWDVWTKGAAPVESCSILTTAANEATAHLHARMPVILDRTHFAAWLDPLTPPPALHELLRPCPADRIALHPAGAAVGNVRNTDVFCALRMIGVNSWVQTVRSASFAHASASAAGTIQYQPRRNSPRGRRLPAWREYPLRLGRVRGRSGVRSGDGRDLGRIA